MFILPFVGDEGGKPEMLTHTLERSLADEAVYVRIKFEPDR